MIYLQTFRVHLALNDLLFFQGDTRIGPRCLLCLSALRTLLERQCCNLLLRCKMKNYDTGISERGIYIYKLVQFFLKRKLTTKILGRQMFLFSLKFEKISVLIIK